MADKIPEFETTDLKGSADTFSGTVGTSLIAVPSSPGNKIQEFTVICDSDQSITKKLEVYLDGGTVIAASLFPGGFYSGKLKGSITQIHIKSNTSGTKYNITLDREEA